MSEETEPVEEQAGQGLYLYGIVRARHWRGLERRSRGFQRVRYRDIEALVKPVAFELPANANEGVREHQSAIEGLMRRTTILPVPFGIIFKGRRAVIKLLQDQYLVIDEGLGLLDGHWELRLHVTTDVVGDAASLLSDEAMNVYAELRRYARAAVPLPTDEKLLSAAFLIDRTSWVEFIERVENYGQTHKELHFDVTGPWPAYDFVHFIAP